MILGWGQATSPDLFVTATQCLGSLRTSAAHQIWTSSRVRALHAGHAGCERSRAQLDKQPEHSGTNNLFSADKGTGLFPPVSLLCCLAIPDVGREITEPSLLHLYTLFPTQQTINSTQQQHGSLLIPLLWLEVRKSKRSACSTATRSVLLYPTPRFLPSTQTGFSFTIQNPQHQPSPDAAGCTCIFHTHPHPLSHKQK